MAPREALRNAEHERKSECSAQATPDEGVLLGGTDAVGSSSEQGAHRIDGRRATCECGHYGGTHRPPETSEVLVPLGEAMSRKTKEFARNGPHPFRWTVCSLSFRLFALI